MYNLALFYLDPLHKREAAAKRYLYKVVVDFPDSEAALAAEKKLAELDEDETNE